MLKSVLAGTALAAGIAAPVLAQNSSIGGTIPAANIGATVGATGPAGIGATGALTGSVTASPMAPIGPLSPIPGLTAPPAPAAPSQAAVAAAYNGVNAGGEEAMVAAAANPIAAGAIVKSQAGVQMGVIDRLIPGPSGAVSGVVLRTPSGALREVPMGALGLSGSMLVTTYSAAQINASPAPKPAQ